MDQQAAVRVSTDPDRITTVEMDLPGKPVNTCSPQMLTELGQALDAIERDKPAGVIFASAKQRSFSAGADLFEIRKMSRETVAEYLKTGQDLFNRIAKLAMPTVAAINGDCLGGGMELALACRYRVAADETSINIGLPETKLGLIPSWGGTTRLPRMIGITKALPILLAGKTMPPRKAMKAGLVDEVVRPEALRAAAKRIAMSKPRVRRPAMFDRVAGSTTWLRNKILDKAHRTTQEQTYGNYPAPMKLLDVVRTGYERGFGAGLEAERTALVEASTTDAGRNLMRLFFLRQGSKKWTAEQINAKPRDIKYAAVVGGGTMGAGIVHSLIRVGIPVRLIEVDAKAMQAGLQRVRKLLDDDVAAGRMDKLAARHAMNRVAPSTDWTGLSLMDVVIEAVIEKMDLKSDVFAKLDKLTRADCVLASNTSSLRVGEMAQATQHPERVIGLHFFNPVPKMPLVEVVRGPQSDDQALATGVGLVNKIGKTPILVNDSPGFLVNRVLIPYLAESLVLATEGEPVPHIDDAMKRWGMPMGPFELLDEIGLDVAAYVLKSLSSKLPGQVTVPSGVEQAIQRGWLGKKSGRGFYVYNARKRNAKPKLNEELKLSSTGVSPVPDDAATHGRDARGTEIQNRLVLPMVNEAARCLEEDVTDSTDAIDLATVLGLGLAPFRGGLVNYANTVGAETIVKQLDELAAKHGPRFTPSELLRELAATHRPMAHLATMDRGPNSQNSNNHAQPEAKTAVHAS
jgi:3-hydroxyacyl-CoA dehydrogenase/enoyl-CoA hydratase/3-hydroxybutyryl-CoA epimerase